MRSVSPRYQRSSELMVRKNGTEYAVFDLSSGKTLQVNQTIFEIMNLCDGKRTEEDMVEQLVKEYGVDNLDDLRADMKQCIQFLRENTLIRAVG